MCLAVWIRILLTTTQMQLKIMEVANIKLKQFFEWDQTFANTMSTNSVSTIKVYNGGTFKGSLAVSGIYWTSAPSCGANSTITLTYDLGTSKSATAPFTFDLCDAANNVITTVSISYIIAANKCNTCQLQ